MGLFDLIFRKQLEKLQQSIGSTVYENMLRNVRNYPVYMPDNVETYIREGYLFNPTVYSVVSFIAQKASSIPWAVYAVKSDKALNLYKSASPNLIQYKKEFIRKKALEEIPNHELETLFQNPNVLQSWSDFVEQAVGFKLVTGNSFISLIFNLITNRASTIYNFLRW